MHIMAPFFVSNTCWVLLAAVVLKFFPAPHAPLWVWFH